MNSRWFAPLIFASAILGWLTAMALPDVLWLDQLTQLMRTAFFSALKMVIAPLIFFSLIAGVMQLRASSQIGRLGAVTISYYLTTTGIAVLIGLIIVLFYHPWTAFPPLVEDPSVLGDLTTLSARLIDPGDGSTFGLLNNLVQRMLINPFDALAEMNVLGILVGAILLGLAAAITLPTDSALPKIFDELAQVTYKLAGWVLITLPIGLFAITFQLAQKIDFSTLAALGQLAGVVFGATLFHGLIVLPAIAWLVSGKNPLQFLHAVSQPMVTALFTSSSAATLPLSMQAAQDKLGVDQARSAFVLPLGATANMDGTALFEGVAAVFLAYMFGIDLGTTGIIAIFLVAMLSSVGAPGIPSGSMAGMQMVLLAVGIPLEAIGLLMLIERPLDTFRTAVNVEGDLVGCLVAKRFAS
jgi:Na+/H+-dicarboxylate symporter